MPVTLSADDFNALPETDADREANAALQPKRLSKEEFANLPQESTEKVKSFATDVATAAADQGKALGRGIARGAAMLPGVVGDIQTLARKAEPFLGIKTPEKPYFKAGTSEEWLNAVEPYAQKLGINLKEKPETLLGQVAQTAGEFVGGGALDNPMALARQGLPSALRQFSTRALLPATTSEAAGQYTKGTDLEPWARVGGALVGAGVPAAADMAFGTRAAENAVTRATRGVTPEQINAAENLINEARARGIDLTRAEALQQVTQGATGLGDVQRVLEGQGGLRDYMSRRPEQVQRAGQQVFGEVSPAPENVQRLGPRAAQAAEEEIMGAHAARTERSRPFYEQAGPQTIPRRDVEDVIRQIDELRARDRTGRTHGPLDDLRNQLVDERGNVVTDIENLDRVRKYFRDLNELPAFAERSIDKETGAKIANLTDQLNTSMMQRSLPFRQGKHAYQEATRDIVEPLEQGTIGKLSKENLTTEQAKNALFPTNPLPSSTEELVRSVQALENRAPNVARDLVRTHLERTFNEATQALQSGPNQFGGAGFAGAVAGNQQQRQNLLAAIGALPNGEQIQPGVESLLNVLAATGQRQRIGSQTAFNTELLEALSGGAPIGKAVTSLGTSIPKTVLSQFREWALGRNTDALARLLTDPRAADDFRRLVLTEPTPRNIRSAILGMTNLANRARPYIQAAANRPERASGGRIGKGDYPAKRLTLAAKQAFREIANETKPIMDMPDEHVADALHKAKG